MTTYLVLADGQNPNTTPAAVAQLAAVGAVPIWPGFWVWETDLQGAQLKESVDKLFHLQGYLITPFQPTKTTAAGIKAGGGKQTLDTFIDSIAKPILADMAGPPGMSDFALESARAMPNGQSFGCSTTD